MIDYTSDDSESVSVKAVAPTGVVPRSTKLNERWLRDKRETDELVVRDEMRGLRE